MVYIKYGNKDGYVIEINPEWAILPITGENITLINITYNWLRYKYIQMQYLPFRIYFCDITLLITTFYEKNLISFLCIILYFANFFSHILYKVVLPEDGQVG